MCGSQTLEQEAVKLKLLWRLQDVRDARAVGDLLEKLLTGSVTSPGERIVLQSTKLEGVHQT